LRDAAQAVVASEVAVVIVVFLKVIDIDEHERHRPGLRWARRQIRVSSSSKFRRLEMPVRPSTTDSFQLFGELD
jgi:hypothetical protein